MNGPLAALDEFMTMLAGPDWRRETERDLPGSLPAMQRDATTFFESDVPALLSWRFEAQDAATIRCPVFCVGGSDSGPWFAAARACDTTFGPVAVSTPPGASLVSGGSAQARSRSKGWS